MNSIQCHECLAGCHLLWLGTLETGWKTIISRSKDYTILVAHFILLPHLIDWVCFQDCKHLYWSNMKTFTLLSRFIDETISLLSINSITFYEKSHRHPVSQLLSCLMIYITPIVITITIAIPNVILSSPTTFLLSIYSFNNEIVVVLLIVLNVMKSQYQLWYSW